MDAMRDFPEHLRRHFEEPRGVGEPARGTDLRGEARNPACGDHLVLYLALERGADGATRIAAAGFRAQGCPAAMATGSAACELLAGLPLDEGAPAALAERFERTYGAPRPAHRHALALCTEALRDAGARA
jgi:NifU-like protein involved in Fe-S cluster formation